MIRDSLRGLITLERKQTRYTRQKETSSSIEALLKKRMKKTLANDTDPLEHRSFLAATIPGTGNSGLCDAFVHQIAPEAHRYRENDPLCLSVSFDGPSGFDSANDWTVLKQANPEHALSTRLLAAYFEIPPRFFQDNFEQTGSFQVAATLQFIQEFEYSARNDSQQPTSHDQLPWLAIAVDGIQQLLGCSSWHNAQRQRRLLDKTLASLKAAVKRPAARLFVLYAGTLSDELTTGLIESFHSQTSTSSKFDVDEEEVPEPPRVDANLESQLHPSGGIPCHIEKVLGVMASGAAAKLCLNARTFIELVHFCAFDAFSINPSSLDARTRSWINTGCAFVACEKDSRGSLQFNLPSESKLDLRSGDAPLRRDTLAQTVRSAYRHVDELQRRMEHHFTDRYLPAVAWEHTVVNLFNLRLIVLVAKALLDHTDASKQLDASKQPDASDQTGAPQLPAHIDVPLSRVLPGVKFGAGCEGLQLRLPLSNWREDLTCMMKLDNAECTLATHIEPAIDCYMHAQVVEKTSGKVRPAVIGLQVKHHKSLRLTTKDEIERLETNARRELARKYVMEEGTVILVGVMLTSRVTITNQPPLSWVMHRGRPGAIRSRLPDDSSLKPLLALQDCMSLSLTTLLPPS
ncbi:hypothetical protein CAOG_09094 [Capsaspora owczarzaki ATCC 30864]|uniref:hypothetical protein n=1 Tax=Capsaspora owczarzaki (strain ATCC 30864) TaxID=595528 RepID=UPI00035255D6|nr:hypothetical protein CAOG_09094 [Capsaspora owczarzaki ATCC 30864]|eukprot:XP_011270751.1 hypothetical protein CAOG_09094 [Capsaspora owczarzaki ATCC 30864]